MWHPLGSLGPMEATSAPGQPFRLRGAWSPLRFRAPSASNDVLTGTFKTTIGHEWRGRGAGMARACPVPPGENGSGRGPDAGRTLTFEETDADRTRTGRGRGRFSQQGRGAPPTCWRTRPGRVRFLQIPPCGTRPGRVRCRFSLNST
eukprot:gene8935-biopygen3177